MLDSLYDLVWEAEFKNLVTPDIIASIFPVETNIPFGIPFKKKHSRVDLFVGDLIHTGPTPYLVLPRGFRELEKPKIKGSR